MKRQLLGTGESTIELGTPALCGEVICLPTADNTLGLPRVRLCGSTQANTLDFCPTCAKVVLLSTVVFPTYRDNVSS
jgi:hypothetical protein